jgi:hypothetical protein
MIDEALPTMIDETLPEIRKMSGSAVARGRIQAHLLVIPGRAEGVDPESRRNL